MNSVPRAFAPDYPLASFHHIVRETAFELVRNVQAPDAMIGMALINAISMACQGSIDVKMPTGQIRPVSQNILLVAESGERKSTVSSLVLAPFRQADMQELTEHRSKMEIFQAEYGLWIAKGKGLRTAVSRATGKGRPTADLEAAMLEHARSVPTKPRLRHFLRQDITAKAIMEALQGDGESIGITTDEGHMLFKSEAMSHLGLLNRLWDSPEALPLDRAENEHLLAMNPRVSVSIMTQHAPLKQFLDRRGSVAKGSGHWARYLVGWPRSKMGYRHVGSEESSWVHLPIFHAQIEGHLNKYREMLKTGSIERELIGFSTDATSRWVDLAGQTEAMLRHGEYLNDINDFAAKVMEVLARLAAAMQYFSGERGDITLDTLNRAFEIVRWHVDEYKYLFSPQSVIPQHEVDADATATYLYERVWQGPFSDTHVLKNDVLRNGRVRDKTRLNAALELLEARGGISIVKDYRSRKIYLQLLNAFFRTMKT
ncbi:YfjI family protein [Stenotrophomonas sp. PS02297]|uniref:YfjI family protein n=1 Tax=unclassified Stenotrophomonas TaxID=196198 RepID=UPI00249BB760|nr:YfjI family protein [Stenotrophomonas sp. PS02297]